MKIFKQSRFLFLAVFAFAAISIQGCKEPSRGALPVQGRSVFDVVKAIQNDDLELFRTFLSQDSAVATEYENQAEFDRLVDYFKSFEASVRDGGWDVKQVPELRASGDWVVEFKSQSESRLRLPQTYVYDVYVYGGVDEATGEKLGEQKIARIRTTGYFYDRWVLNRHQHRWVNETYYSNDWKLTQIDLIDE